MNLKRLSVTVSEINLNIISYQAANSNHAFFIKKNQGLENPISKTIYKEFNRNTEKITSLINSVGIKILYPIVMMPPLIASFYSHFTTNAGNDAFQMPYPYW